jgi:hypothetical protein
MAIFGIGAYYDQDVTSAFLKQHCACLGWREKDAPPAHALLRAFRTGDIIFIKSFTPEAGLMVKAVGLVLEGRVREIKGLGSGVPVRWAWNGEKRIGRLDDKWPVRSVTIYEEYHPEVQGVVLRLLLGAANRPIQRRRSVPR